MKKLIYSNIGLNKLYSAYYTHKTQGIVWRPLAALSSSCKALLVQHNTRLWSLASWQKAASWHHTCSSNPASVQLHSDAMLTSLRWVERWVERSKMEMVREKKRRRGGGGTGRGIKNKDEKREEDNWGEASRKAMKTREEKYVGGGACKQGVGEN